MSEEKNFAAYRLCTGGAERMIEEAQKVDSSWRSLNSEKYFEKPLEYAQACASKIGERVKKLADSLICYNETELNVRLDEVRHAAQMQDWKLCADSIRQVVHYLCLKDSRVTPQKNGLTDMQQLFDDVFANTEKSLEGILQLMLLFSRWMTLFSYFSRTYEPFVAKYGRRAMNSMLATESQNTFLNRGNREPPQWLNSVLETFKALAEKKAPVARKRSSPASKKCPPPPKKQRGKRTKQEESEDDDEEM